ncbi:site-specific DNA-methyltransferase (adenine-specific)/modification methylase [Mucilaginibacter sp. OK268]|uniref:DNA-methyltransferase n=1 Tax=Mucilaginibacter sp. OK268 TaxID=1881048 RepID=UPI000884DC14|nr:site-specific DNA-methyltransferase [Mucilaginibacter sp. OK268]SDP46515.1 site-specific DNA-methyltransferase (adenine-specific)/modification methylase [Mucilaginibacter sp. OK268]
MQSLEPYLNQVTQGDCLEIMQYLPDQSIDLILCDLPYGTTVNEWDKIIDFKELWLAYERLIKPKGVIALTGSAIFTAKLIMSNLILFKYKIVWIKSRSTNFLNAKKQPLRKHEDICIFYKNQPDYQPQMMPGEPYNKGWRKDQSTGCYGKYKPSNGLNVKGHRYPYDVLFIEEDPADDWFYCKTAENEDESPVHPTQKPVELGQYLIRTFTKPGDIVLDNACGSGTFLVAAIIENRSFIGIEKNEGCYHQKHKPIDLIQVARDRIKREMAKRAADF